MPPDLMCREVLHGHPEYSAMQRVQPRGVGGRTEVIKHLRGGRERTVEQCGGHFAHSDSRTGKKCPGNEQPGRRMKRHDRQTFFVCVHKQQWQKVARGNGKAEMICPTFFPSQEMVSKPPCTFGARKRMAGVEKKVQGYFLFLLLSSKSVLLFFFFLWHEKKRRQRPRTLKWREHCFFKWDPQGEEFKDPWRKSRFLLSFLCKIWHKETHKKNSLCNADVCVFLLTVTAWIHRTLKSR